VVGHGACELDVLTLIGRARSNTEIARELCISEGTVKSHVGHIFDKLGLHDRAAAVVYAFDHNIALPVTTPPSNAGTHLSQGVAKGI
jgi:DNA-binding CsgD family transcriptional regulator